MATYPIDAYVLRKKLIDKYVRLVKDLFSKSKTNNGEEEP